MNLEEKREFFEVLVTSEQQLDFSKIYGNDRPVHLEIGSGKGEFLCKKSLQSPEINLLGIELKEKRIKVITRKLNPDIHKNVRLIRLFVDENINKLVKPDSIDVIYIQHPDPWPKRAHFCRRMIQQKFLDALNHILKMGGTIELSTDHKGYADWIMKEFRQRKDYVPVFENEFTMERQENHIVTFFEIEQRNAGFEPVFMHYRKVSEVQND